MNRFSASIRRQLGIALFILTMCNVFMPVPAQAQAEEITVWSYYVFPPFIAEGNQGLTHGLLGLMDEEADGRFTFHLQIMPRKRIEQQIAAGDQGIVLFISPEWFDLPGEDAVWSGTLFADRNGILFSGLRQINYSGPQTLFGMTMGGVVGRRYKGIDGEVESGRIIREDVLDEELNVLKLAERRIDFMTAPESVLRYLVAHLGAEKKVNFSPTPLFEYTRHILINRLSPEAREFVLQFVRDLPTNPSWLKLKKKYKLQ